MILERLRTNLFYRYAFAVLSVICFTVVKLYLESSFGADRPFFFMRLAVLLTAFLMGLGPAILALLISAVAVDYLFLAPRFSLSLTPSTLYSETLFVLETGLMVAIIIVLRRALAQASQRAGLLAQTEERLQVALRGSNISVATCDRDLRYVWVYNMPPDFSDKDVLGKTTDEFFPGEQATALESAKRQVLETGVGARLELSVPLSRGVRTFEIVIEPQRDNNGAVQGVMVASSDITERNRYEQVLREEEANFRQLADSMPQIVWAAQPDGYIDYWNRRWYEFTGFPQGEGGDDSWIPVVHPDDMQHALNDWYRCVHTGVPLQVECRLRDLHAGEFRWFLNRAVPVRNAQGQIEKWYGSLTDMHDYRAAIDALRKSEERFRSLVTASAQIVWTTNAAGEVEDMPEWRALTGQTVDQVAGYGWLDAVHPQDRATTLQHWDKAVKSGGIYAVEYRIRRDDGSYHWFSVRGVPVRDADGTIREWVGLCVDVEDQRRAQEQMQHAAEAMAVARDAAVQANRAKSAFLANISHELRTPLNAILGYAEILQEDIGNMEKPQMMSDVERIFTAGTHLLAVVNDLLDISKIEAGRMSLDMRNFEVKGVLDNVCNTVLPMAERNGNQLKLETPDNSGIICTDQNKLRQILMNLLSNACKFTENGEVTLRCWRAEEKEREWVYFAVSDTGIGIAEQDLPKLFHDFSQLDASFTRRYGGTGLGLAICERFAVLLGGEISVESEPGKGSTFTLRLPVINVAARKLEVASS